jgi:hypothetical protein
VATVFEAHRNVLADDNRSAAPVPHQLPHVPVT